MFVWLVVGSSLLEGLSVAAAYATGRTNAEAVIVGTTSKDGVAQVSRPQPRRNVNWSRTLVH